MHTRQVFFFTDVHGHYGLYKIIMNYCKAQDPDCTIIFGGDAADRGPDGYTIMKELLDDPQVIYLYGNHEELFINAAEDILKYFQKNNINPQTLTFSDIMKMRSDITSYKVSLHLQNGGDPTLTSWLCNQAETDILTKLKALPRTVSYDKMDFCHAGGSYIAFQEVANAEYYHLPIPTLAENYIIWDRTNLPNAWEPDRIAIFGHTPSNALSAKLYGSMDKTNYSAKPAVWQGSAKAGQKPGLKVDMDTGMSWTNRGFVLNCLTGMVQGFDFNTPQVTILEPYKLF